MNATPTARGPWRVGPHYKCDVESPDGRVCECGPMGSPFGEANARLIAALPDLLEELKNTACALAMALRANVSRDLFDSDDEYDAAIRSHVVLRAANAAIAKAEGR